MSSREAKLFPKGTLYCADGTIELAVKNTIDRIDAIVKVASHVAAAAPMISPLFQQNLTTWYDLPDAPAASMSRTDKKARSFKQLNPGHVQSVRNPGDVRDYQN